MEDICASFSCISNVETCSFPTPHSLSRHYTDVHDPVRATGSEREEWGVRPARFIAGHSVAYD